MCVGKRDVAACTRYFRVDRRDLVYLKFILEAYEGLSTLSTVEKDGALVRISTFPWCAADIGALIEALRTEISITETAPPPDAGEGRVNA
jgi:hypothetical protein